MTLSPYSQRAGSLRRDRHDPVADLGIGNAFGPVRIAAKLSSLGLLGIELISRARRPDGASSEAATGRMESKRSTARRVTTLKLAGGRISARAFCISTSVNVRARATSRRNAAFLWFDSISVTDELRRPEFDGEAGESGAGTDVGEGLESHRWLWGCGRGFRACWGGAHRRLSPKWRRDRFLRARGWR